MSEAPTGGSSDDEIDVEELSDELLESISEGISRLTRQRRSLRPTIANLHAKWLSDEPVQQELQELLREVDEEGETVAALQMLDRSDVDIEDILSECQARELLSEDTAHEAQAFLEEISWTFPAAQALIQASQGEHYWTDIVTGLAGENEDGETLIGQRAHHGVDEIWDIQAPLHAMLGQNLQEIGTILQQLRNLPPASEFNEEELQRLERFADTVNTISDQAEDAIEDITQKHGGGNGFDPEEIDDLDPSDLLE